MTFREFVELKEEFSQDPLSTVRIAILNFLGATPDALDDPLVNFKNYRKLLDAQRNPQLGQMIAGAKNNGAIIQAINNAGVTKISIADLVSLFRAGMSGNLPGGRKAPTPPQPVANQQKPANPQQQNGPPQQNNQTAPGIQ